MAAGSSPQDPHSPSAPHIRRARGTDFLAVADLDRRAWGANRHSEYVPDGEHVWRIWCEHGVTYVAVDADRIVGVALAFPCADGRYCMHKVFVAPTHRGHGLGTRLMERTLEELDTLRVSAFLTVDPVNDKALGLYERMGFTGRQFVAGYYRPHEDRFLLTRPARKERET